MKYMIKACVLASLALCFQSAKLSTAEETEKIHPRNKVLMELYPRDFGFRFPSVLRVTGQEALELYESGQAFFIHVGVEGGDVAGGIHISEKQSWSIPVEKLKLLVGDKIIVAYCD